MSWECLQDGPLQAGDIADIIRLLRAQQVNAGGVIAGRGVIADCMYFVAAGEVEIELKEQRVPLGAGHFFGEVAVLRRARRSPTVSAITRTSLLLKPRITERIREVVRTRVGRDIGADDIAAILAYLSSIQKLMRMVDRRDT